MTTPEDIRRVRRLLHLQAILVLLQLVGLIFSVLVAMKALR